MNIAIALRVITGLAVMAAGVWLFVRKLPVIDFSILALPLALGVLIIEAPRFLKMLRQRRERFASFVEADATAQKLLQRAAYVQRLSWICHAVAVALACAGFVLFGPERLPIILSIALALMAVGFALGLYRVFARTSLDFQSLSAAKPAMSQRKMWLITGGLFAAVILALVAESVWHIEAMNWLYGALSISFVAAFVWRWLRGWPKDFDHTP